MSDVIRVEYVNEVHMKVLADPGIRQEIMNFFSFRPEGYQFSPKFKARVWDGWIRLYQPLRPLLYVGLSNYLRKFCEDRGYELQFENDWIEDFWAAGCDPELRRGLRRRPAFDLWSGFSRQERQRLLRPR